jgi:AraC-like DNA-binding protein
VIFRQYRPSKALAAYIKCYWVLESEYFPGPPERILPDGCTELIFHYGDNYHRISDGKPLEQPKNILVGQIKQAIELQATGKTGMFGIRFHPWGLYPFTGVPSDKFADLHIESGQFFKDIHVLSEQFQFLGHEEMVVHVEAYLIGVFKKQKQRHFYDADRFAAIIPEMLKDVSSVSVSSIAGMANMSERQFNRKFGEVIGLSPKHFIRIARVQQFVNSYNPGNRQRSLGDLIYDCGYYDPAHFSKDFKDIAGVSPSIYFEGIQDLGKAMLL